MDVMLAWCTWYAWWAFSIRADAGDDIIGEADILILLTALRWPTTRKRGGVSCVHIIRFILMICGALNATTREIRCHFWFLLAKCRRCRRWCDDFCVIASHRPPSSLSAYVFTTHLFIAFGISFDRMIFLCRWYRFSREAIPRRNLLTDALGHEVAIHTGTRTGAFLTMPVDTAFRRLFRWCFAIAL